MAVPNKLIHEQSPYLLQHAYNPVDWYPWGEAAFAKAEAEGKPIFLSIGYSTCHWCHVMEKESFEDAEVAQLMNDAFVSIKVDREERPDVDGIYMTICQMLTGSGGWPLTIVMTPDKKPFFAGTYFPKNSRYGRAGMLELIPRLDNIWKTKHEEVLKSAEEITRSLVSSSNFSGDKSLSPDILKKAFTDLSKRFDSVKGGFGRAPKFPTPHTLSFLLRYWKKSKDEHALLMVEETLKNMRYGGIYDHVGFGFHRYSTDQNWLLPHFEKMLYDQALLSIAYTEAYQVTKKDLYKKTTQEILEYVSRDMISPEGGFYSAEDADSEGEEGKFYLWTKAEVKKILKDDAELIIQLFNLEEEGNWIDPMHSGKNGTNIFHLKISLDEFTSENNLTGEKVNEKIDNCLYGLFEDRDKRIHPHKDDKILTDWNGLMISAFAKAAQVFDNKEYSDTAESAINFIMKKLVRSNGRLLHRYRNGSSDIDGNLNDYAFLIAALLDLYETTFSAEYLDKAVEFQKILNEYFGDVKDGGYFFTASDGEQLLVRQKEIYDGAIPSGNSVALHNLIRLQHLTGDTAYGEKADAIIKIFSQVITVMPSAYTSFLSGLDFYFGPSKEILLVGNNENKLKEYSRAIQEKFIPNKTIIKKNGKNTNVISSISNFTSSYSIEEGHNLVYICDNFACQLPVSTKEDLLKKLGEL